MLKLKNISSQCMNYHVVKKTCTLLYTKEQWYQSGLKESDKDICTGIMTERYTKRHFNVA